MFPLFLLSLYHCEGELWARGWGLPPVPLQRSPGTAPQPCTTDPGGRGPRTAAERRGTVTSLRSGASPAAHRLPGLLPASSPCRCPAAPAHACLRPRGVSPPQQPPPCPARCPLTGGGRHSFIVRVLTGLRTGQSGFRWLSPAPRGSSGRRGCFFWLVRFSFVLCFFPARAGVPLPHGPPPPAPRPGARQHLVSAEGFFAFGCVFWLLFLISVLL